MTTQTKFQIHHNKEKSPKNQENVIQNREIIMVLVVKKAGAQFPCQQYQTGIKLFYYRSQYSMNIHYSIIQMA